MNLERQQTLRGHIGRGFLVSLLFHGSFIFPIVVFTIIFARREAENRDVDVKFEEVSAEELPENLPELQALPPEPPGAEEEELPEAPFEVPPPPELVEEEKKAEQKPVAKDKAKAVDLDMGKEVEPPPDAKYLAQKNNRAEEETRARDTNLEREQKGEKGSSPSDRKDQEVGDADQKIAEL